jgi:hypothetical protein
MGIWAQHAPAIETHMRNEAEKARYDYFEYLYVHRDDKLRAIQLFAGNHPIATNADGSFQTEGGAALVLSQDTTFGHVAALIYPYETAQGQAKPILWGVFDSPADAVAGDWLDRAVHDFARCCRASSAVDPTVYRSDHIRMRYLQFRAWILRLRGRLPGCTKLIRAKPSWVRRILLASGAVLAALTYFSSLPSNLSTLSGYSAPALWDAWHAKPSPSGAVVPAKQNMHPAKAAAASSSQLVERVKSIGVNVVPEIAPMPVISGWYTFCPTEGGKANPKLLDLLYDVRTNAGKVAFFDVQVDIDCVLGRQPDRRRGQRELPHPRPIGQCKRYCCGAALD